MPSTLSFVRIDARDRIHRAVAVGIRRHLATRIAVAEGHQAVAFEPPQRLFVGRVVALAMRDADVDGLALGVAPREGGVVALDAQELPVADEFQVGVAHQDAGKKPGFAQDLEAVADAEHQAAPRRMSPHRIHHGRATRDRAAAQIIAVREPAGQDHEVGAGGQLGLGVPDFLDLRAGLLERPQRRRLRDWSRGRR